MRASFWLAGGFVSVWLSSCAPPAVTGRLTSNANGFSAAFSELGGASITGNGVTLIRNVFPAGQATVPSSNAVLVDNFGLP